MASGAALIWCPFPDEASALDAIRRLLGENRIACANILPTMRSLYLWQGAVEESAETGVLFKTTAVLLDSAIARLSVLHPYDTPAIIGWQADAAAPQTLGWLDDMLGKAGNPQGQGA